MVVKGPRESWSNVNTAFGIMMMSIVVTKKALESGISQSASFNTYKLYDLGQNRKVIKPVFFHLSNGEHDRGW